MKSRDTKPEVLLQNALKALEINFECHRSDLPGTPDIAISRQKIAIFVHGCYWHRHQNCGGQVIQSVKSASWADTFNSIVRRDGRTEMAIQNLGWQYLVAWECEIKRDALGKAIEIQAIARRLEARQPKE